jgi:hypothetical protein
VGDNVQFLDRFFGHDGHTGLPRGSHYSFRVSPRRILNPIRGIAGWLWYSVRLIF